MTMVSHVLSWVWPFIVGPPLGCLAFVLLNWFVFREAERINCGRHR